MNFFDIQINGYAGADFCSSNLTVEQLRHACSELRADGVDQILATVITDEIDSLCAKLRRLVEFRESDDLIHDVISGFHIEGPFLNASPGFIGAHPPQHVRPASTDEMKQLLEAAGGLTKVVTLAPENDPGMKTVRFLADQKITVSAGHCDSDLQQLHAAIDAGLSMVTHLGNGCPVNLPRHDNFIQRALSLSDQLWICYIPDGVHIDFFALKNYLKISGLERSIMVTDAIAAAKMGPGIHELSDSPVEIDENGIARRPGSENLAGSTLTMPVLMKNLSDELNLNDKEIEMLISRNPRLAIGYSDSSSGE